MIKFSQRLTLLIESDVQRSQLVKIKPNLVTETHVRKQGSENWALKHLPLAVRDDFENCLAPLVRLKAGALTDPWESPKTDDLQALVDNVYGSEKHTIKEDGAFYGVVSALEGFELS